MKTSQPIGFLFWISSSRAKGKAAELYASIKVDGKRVNIRLKRKINTKSWDVRKSRIGGRVQGC